jgi:membrane dipeptidase
MNRAPIGSFAALGVLLAVATSCGAGVAPVAVGTPPPPPPVAEAPPPPAPIPAPPALAPAPSTLEERAARLHAGAIVVDTHDDVTSAILEDGFDLAHPNGKTATDLPRMRAGGVTAEFFSIYVDSRYYERPSSREGGAARRALDMIDVTYQQIERHPRDLVLATSADDIRRAKKDGKIAVLMGIEGGHAIENSLQALREFYRLGVRYMTLTHSGHNDWADSSGMGAAPPKPRHHGLSPFGEDVVEEMQRIGMLVDVSHVSDETIEDVLRISVAPVIASHSSARALCDAPRNLSDEELVGIAATGGVVMVNFFSGYLDPGYRNAMHAFFARHGGELAALDKKGVKLSAIREAALKMGAGDLPKVPLGVLVDHIEHIAKVAGVDHVGLGSDYDGVDSMPEGLQGIDGLPKITLELLRRGWSDEDVKKVLGENFLRAFAGAEAHARSANGTLSGDGSTKRIESTCAARATCP